MQNGWPTAFLMNILKSLGGRWPLPISQLVFIYNRNEWTPLTTLRMCLTWHGIRQVLLGNAHTYQERTSKQTNKNWMSIVRWCLDWRFFWDLRSPILVKIKFLWAQSNTPWGIPREKKKGASLPFWSWLLRHSSPHHHSCRRLGCWWSHSSCPPWKAGKWKSRETEDMDRD